MLNNMLVHGLDPSTRRPQEIEVVGKALKVYVASLLSGELQERAFLTIANATREYVQGAFVTTAVDVILGQTGAAGDILETLWIWNNSGSAFTAFAIYDGSTTIDFLDLVTWQTLASGTGSANRLSLTIPGGIESKNGGWKLRVTCAGTMASIKFGAKGQFT